MPILLIQIFDTINLTMIYVILCYIFVVEAVLGIRFDGGTRVINDTSIWDTVNIQRVETNATWNDGPALSLQWGYQEFEPQYMRGYNPNTNEMMHMSGSVIQLSPSQREVVSRKLEEFKGNVKSLVVDNENSKIILQDFGKQVTTRATSTRIVRVYDVREDKITSDVLADYCSCVYDMDSFKLTVGVIDKKRYNYYTESCPGRNLCVMSSQGTVSPFVDPGFSQLFRRVMDTLVNYELAMMRKRCERSDNLGDLIGFINWFVLENPKRHTFEQALSDKIWNILC